jgi:hypothetical protein
MSERSPKHVASVNDGTHRPVQTFPIALRFHIENAHTSIGIHNEHFLHHRRSGCYHLCCKLPGFARLKVRSAPLLDNRLQRKPQPFCGLRQDRRRLQCSVPTLGFFVLIFESSRECAMAITSGHMTSASRFPCAQERKLTLSVSSSGLHLRSVRHGQRSNCLLGEGFRR